MHSQNAENNTLSYQYYLLAPPLPRESPNLLLLTKTHFFEPCVQASFIRKSRQPPCLSQHLSQNPLPSAPGQRCTQAFLPASCPRDHIIADEILSINGASPTDRIIAPVKADPAGENLPELLFLPLRQPHVKPRGNNTPWSKDLPAECYKRRK